MSKKKKNLIWIDLEMTGLIPDGEDSDVIIEIATIVTDSDLKVIEEGPVLAIYQPPEVLDKMDEWNTRQHNQSGLVERVLNSEITEAQAEAETLAFLKKHVSRKASPMCGNSICQDRRFLVRYMPELADYFHYRNLDVSTLKELAKRWNRPVYSRFCKDSKHLALEDIRDSINELRYYRKYFLNLAETHEVAPDDHSGDGV